MHKKFFFLLVPFFGFLLSASDIYGAPFCVETQGNPSECWYYDIRTCKEEAEKKGALCTANPREISFKGQRVPFCIVDSGMKPVCAFQSRDSCQQEATRRDNAVCVQNIGSDETKIIERKTLPEIFAEKEPQKLLPENREGGDAGFFELEYTATERQ